MKFIDQTEIHVTAGNGGDGISSFRRARNRPKLGPDGGNGGNGGDVYLVCAKGLNTLSSLRYRQKYSAEHGGKGQSNEKTGRCGVRKLIEVPLGTVVRNRETGESLGELLHAGQSLLVAKGGKRGYGNLHFTSPTNRAPYHFTHGQKGEALSLSLELKLLADVGLAGFPNAGKSTLLSKITAARPKIADYPFTTLSPQLGVVELGDDAATMDSFVLADIPGLIEGAKHGKGLGHDFLRHLERTKIVVFVLEALDVTGRSPADSLEVLRKELEGYSSTFSMKKFLVVVNKVDLIDESEEKVWAEQVQELGKGAVPVLQISALTGNGLKELKYKIAATLSAF